MLWEMYLPGSLYLARRVVGAVLLRPPTYKAYYIKFNLVIISLELKSFQPKTHTRCYSLSGTARLNRFDTKQREHLSPALSRVDTQRSEQPAAKKQKKALLSSPVS